MKTAQSAPRRALSLLLTLLVLFSLTGSVLAAGSVTVSGTYGQTEARTMLEMVNSCRTSSKHAWYFDKDSTTKLYCKNLKPLAYDYTLEKIAMLRAAELAYKYDKGHKRPNGEPFYTAYPQNVFLACSENIAAGSIYQTARNMMGVDPVFSSSLPGNKDYGWMETNEGYSGQGHRRTILSDAYTAIGVGHFVVGDTHYWVQEFGKPMSGGATSGAAATPANDAKATVTVSLIPSSQQEEPIGTILTIPNVSATCSKFKQSQQLLLPSGSKLTFQSSNQKKVSVNKKGKITIAANFVGIVTVKVKGSISNDAIVPTKFKVTVKPAAPSLSPLTASKKRQITAKWAVDKTITGYQVQVASDSGFKRVAASAKYTSYKKNSYTTKALKKGKYYVRVRSWKKVGSTNLYSAWRKRNITVK